MLAVKAAIVKRKNKMNNDIHTRAVLSNDESDACPSSDCSGEQLSTGISVVCVTTEGVASIVTHSLTVTVLISDRTTVVVDVEFTT